MTKEDEDNLLRWLQDKDISEVMDLLMKHCNRYSRRILKFFRWFCKYVPITIMLFHAYGMWNFSQHPRDMFIPYAEIRLAISTYILWCTSYLWFLYWQADFSSCVGDTAFPSSTLQASMRLTLLNGAGIPPKI